MPQDQIPDDAYITPEEAKKRKAKLAKKKGQKKRQERKVDLQDREEHAWRVAQLASTLASRHVALWNPVEGRPDNRLPKTHDAFDEASAAFDDFYQGCVNRAEDLLKRARRNTSYVYAHELFEPGRFYTVGEITAFFAAANWSGLTSETSVRIFVIEAIEYLEEKNNESLECHAQEINDEIHGLHAAEMCKKMEIQADICSKLKMKVDRGMCYNMNSLMRLSEEQPFVIEKFRRERFLLSEELYRFD